MLHGAWNSLRGNDTFTRRYYRKNNMHKHTKARMYTRTHVSVRTHKHTQEERKGGAEILSQKLGLLLQCNNHW